jgi:hypothetical protein
MTSKRFYALVANSFYVQSHVLTYNMIKFQVEIYVILIVLH